MGAKGRPPRACPCQVNVPTTRLALPLQVTSDARTAAHRAGPENDPCGDRRLARGCATQDPVHQVTPARTTSAVSRDRANRSKGSKTTGPTLRFGADDVMKPRPHLCVRLFTPSLMTMCCTWFWAVPSEQVRLVGDLLVRLAAATSAATSDSLADSGPASITFASPSSIRCGNSGMPSLAHRAGRLEAGGGPRPHSVAQALAIGSRSPTNASPSGPSANWLRPLGASSGRCCTWRTSGTGATQIRDGPLADVRCSKPLDRPCGGISRSRSPAAARTFSQEHGDH